MTQGNMVIVKSNDLPISIKHAVEISNFIRMKEIEKAKRILNLVLDKKLAIPALRFKRDRAHRKGRIAAGFYPEKAIKYFLKTLSSLQANAQNKGLNGEKLLLEKVIANKASSNWHYGRHRGRTMRKTHLEIIGREFEVLKNKKKEDKKDIKKKEEKPLKGVEKSK